MKVGSGRIDHGLHCALRDEPECYLKKLLRASWIPGRRNGLARGIYNRLKEDDRFSGKQVFPIVQANRPEYSQRRGAASLPTR